MFDSQTTVVAVAPTDIPTRVSGGEKRQRLFEVCLVLLVACGASILNSFYLLIHGPASLPHISNSRWTIGMVQEITGLLLLGYILSRRGLSLTNLGFRWSVRDAGMGILVAGLSYAAYVIGSMLVHLLHYSIYGSLANGPTGSDFFAHPSVLAIPFSLLNPFFEELIVRAYLMSEVLQLTGSSTLAVILSTAVQFSYHLYYGWAGATSLAFVFLTLALYYARTRRALPVIIAHGFFDIYPLIRLW
jgi:membrane protease YdiL (CAAX protease family)